MSKNDTEAILEHIEKTPYESFRVKEDILPHIKTPLHYHPHYELVWIKTGFGVRIVGDHFNHFRENDMVLIGSNLPHVWKNDPVYYTCNPDLIADVYVVHFTDEISNELISRFPELMKIKHTLFNARRGIHISGETKLLSSEEFANLFCEKESERLRKTYEYISKNFHRNIQLEEVSSIACLSPTAFCRYFKQKTGQSFISFLNNFRLGYAKNLMNSNTYKISVIAQMCGFQDVSYFSQLQ